MFKSIGQTFVTGVAIFAMVWLMVSFGLLRVGDCGPTDYNQIPQVTIDDAPPFLDPDERAGWVQGWNAAQIRMAGGVR